MNKIKSFRRISALLLVFIMLILTACSPEQTGEEGVTGDDNAPTITYTETTQNVKKSENIYVNLAADGSVNKITVSDWLHADKGNVKVTDTTTLRDFVVTRGQAASVTEKGELTWHMTTSDVYYEGTSDKALPIEISIKYFLDGNEITAEDLAGKSGNFRMEVTMKNNAVFEVESNGTKHTMYAPLAVVGGLMLPYETFTNVEIENGLSVGGGSYEAVVMMGAPGLNESLGLDKLNIQGFENFSFPSTFAINATVTNFTLGDAYFAAMPLSELEFDVEMPKTIEDARALLTEVQDMSVLLEQIDPNQVVAEFMTDTAAIKEMLDIMKKGLSVYNENKKMLTTMTELLTPENIETLSNFMNSLDAEEMQSLLNIMSNVPALSGMIDSLMNLSTGLDEVMPILESFSAALEDPEVAASLEKLPETLETLSELMNYLNENEELLDVLSKLMATDNIDSLTAALDNVASNTTISGTADLSGLTEEGQMLLDKMNAWLAIDYTIYTSAPDYMETSCMFIMKTDPIK